MDLNRSNCQSQQNSTTVNQCAASFISALLCPSPACMGMGDYVQIQIVNTGLVQSPKQKDNDTEIRVCLTGLINIFVLHTHAELVMIKCWMRTCFILHSWGKLVTKKLTRHRLYESLWDTKSAKCAKLREDRKHSKSFISLSIPATMLLFHS